MPTIGVIAGDGVGPEVVREALAVLEAVAGAEGFRYETVPFDLGGERYLKTGDVLPDDGLDELRRFDAILLGAVGHPDVPPGILEKGLLLRLRFGLDQYINLRPVKLFPGVETPLKGKGPDDIDFVVVRENTEDLYCGAGGFMHKGTPDEVATQTAIYTRGGGERCIRYAFELARPRRPRRSAAWAPTTPSGKSSCHARRQDERADLRPRPVVAGVQGGRRGVSRRQDRLQPRRRLLHVDGRRTPSGYDVIVTTNMFGDIITDLGAVIQGGMGVAAGATSTRRGRRRACSSRCTARPPTSPARGSPTRSPRSSRWR